MIRKRASPRLYPFTASTVVIPTAIIRGNSRMLRTSSPTMLVRRPPSDIYRAEPIREQSAPCLPSVQSCPARPRRPWQAHSRASHNTLRNSTYMGIRPEPIHRLRTPPTHILNSALVLAHSLNYLVSTSASTTLQEPPRPPTPIPAVQILRTLTTRRPSPSQSLRPSRTGQALALGAVTMGIAAPFYPPYARSRRAAAVAPQRDGFTR